MRQQLLSKALRAICLTRDYVGERMLPAINGWEWYEVGKELAGVIPEDEWAKEFWKRVEADKDRRRREGRPQG